MDSLKSNQGSFLLPYNVKNTIREYTPPSNSKNCTAFQFPVAYYEKRCTIATCWLIQELQLSSNGHSSKMVEQPSVPELFLNLFLMSSVLNWNELL